MLPRQDPALAELRAELVAVRARLAALEARHGVRDAAESAVLLAIASAVGDRSFTSKELMAHAAQDADLADALLDADVESIRACGKLMARLVCSPVDGYRLRRLGDSRAGAVWRVQV